MLLQVGQLTHISITKNQEFKKRKNLGESVKERDERLRRDLLMKRFINPFFPG